MFIGYAFNRKGYCCYILKVESFLCLLLSLSMKSNLFTCILSFNGRLLQMPSFLELSFIPLAQEPFYIDATLGTSLDISHMDSSDATLDKGNFVPKWDGIEC